MSYDREAKVANIQGAVLSMETLRKRLERNREQTADRLAAIDKTIAFLDANPGFEEFHNLIGKVGY